MTEEVRRGSIPKVSNSEAIGKLGHRHFHVGGGRSQTARKQKIGNRVGEGKNFQRKGGAEKECCICQDTWESWRTKPRSHFLWPCIHCLLYLYRKVSCAQGPWWLQERNSSIEKDAEYLGEKENEREQTQRNQKRAG